MNSLDTLVISYVLDKQGVPFDLIEHFTDALAEGVHAGELDFIATRRQLLDQARAVAEIDDEHTRQAILSVLAHINMTNSRHSDHPELTFPLSTPATSKACRSALHRAAVTLSGIEHLAISA